MGYEHVVVERVGREGRIAVVTLNRPEVLNAFNTSAGRELGEAFRDLGHDRDVWCVILTGAGGRAFSTGADLKERQGMTDEAFLEQHRIFDESMAALLAIEAPVVAAVEGYCLAGGFESALACDLIVSSERAVFGLPEVMRGIFPGTGSTQFLPRLVGKALAKDLIFTGRRMAADEAYRRGIVSHLVPEGRAFEKALEVAEAIVANAPLAVRQAKKAIERGCDMDLRSGMEFALECYHATVLSEDRREGMAAFNEKRAPRFRNR